MWNKRIGKMVGLMTGIGLVFFLLLMMARQEGDRRTRVDKRPATLLPCPESPNCISTQASPEDTIHYMAPMTYEGSVGDAKAKLLAIVGTYPRTTVITDQPDYLHVEFRSLVFRFVDDVEFLLDDQDKVIHFRSASRLGYSDLGVNRKRMQSIVDAYSPSARR